MTPAMAAALQRRLKIKNIELQAIQPVLRPRKLFEFYVEQRLAFLDRQLRQQIKLVIENRVRVRTNFPGNEEMSAYMMGIKLIGVGLAKSLKESYLHYGFLIHELEHAIQQHQIGMTADQPLEVALSADAAGGTLFEMESGALLAEGAYLVSVPKEDLRDIDLKLEQIIADRKWHSLSFERFVVDLALRSNSPKEYLSLNHSSGRYSKDQCFAISLSHFWSLCKACFEDVLGINSNGSGTK